MGETGMDEHILSIDQSTQATKAMLFNRDGELLLRRDAPHRQLVDEKGWLENDPQEIYNNVLRVVPEVLHAADLSGSAVCAVALTNQRETAVAWDRDTGRPIGNAILWHCPRGEKICAELAEQGYGERIREATGTTLSPYFSAAKMAWILRNIPEAQKLADAGRLCLGTMDSWLIFRLTGGREFRTDYSNAARTQLFNIRTLEWDPEVLKAFGIPLHALPQLTASNGDFGSTDFDGLLPHPVPIRAVLGDSNAALYGQGCIEAGMVKATYGTGTSVMMNTGSRSISSRHLTSSIAWGSREDMTYVLEGNINYTGSVITWLRDELQLIRTSEETEQLALAANPDDHTYLVPAFSGMGAPYWNADAHALICGMTRMTGRPEFVKAALESIAYQVADVISVMEQEGSLGIQELRVDGGVTRNDYLMQFQTDILGKPVSISSIAELSALGAAFMAGEALGLYSPVMLLAAGVRRTLTPQMPEEMRTAKYDGWLRALHKVLSN